MLASRERELDLRKRLIACAENRRELLNELVEMHAGRMLALARRYSQGNDGLREDLEDHLIEALIAAAQRYDPAVSAFWTYAQAVLVGAVKMYFRKQHRSRYVSLTALVSDPADQSADVAVRVADIDALESARKMLAEVGLSGDVAVAALLRQVSVADAARMLNVNYEVFRRRLARARRGYAARSFLRRSADADSSQDRP